MVGDNSALHIISLGKNKNGGYAVKVYGEEKKGLQAYLQAFAVRQATTAAPTQKPSTQQPFPSLPAF